MMYSPTQSVQQYDQWNTKLQSVPIIFCVVSIVSTFQKMKELNPKIKWRELKATVNWFVFQLIIIFAHFSISIFRKVNKIKELVIG